MIRPTLQKIEISAAQIPEALRVLEQGLQLPDGTEVARHVLARYRRQLEAGYFHRLAWPDGATKEQALEWFDAANEIVRWHRMGLV